MTEFSIGCRPYIKRIVNSIHNHKAKYKYPSICTGKMKKFVILPLIAKTKKQGEQNYQVDLKKFVQLWYGAKVRSLVYFRHRKR